jgi:DNA-binding Lrp family transcriptional regulator
VEVIMDELDIRLLKTVQDGLKLTKRPYLVLGEKMEMSEEEVIQRLSSLVDEGVVRRFAAAIGHRALGIVANAMIVWKVPAQDVERIGHIIASFEDVTHCYERAAQSDWPYNIYAMVHSRSREECVRIASEISRAIEVGEYRVLFSEQEYKKTSARI